MVAPKAVLLVAVTVRHWVVPMAALLVELMVERLVPTKADYLVEVMAVLRGALSVVLMV